MKKLIIISICIIASTTIRGLSSPMPVLNELQKDISDAIRTANVTVLARYFNTTIDLSVPGNEGTFSKAQAELILKDFFSKNQPSSFKINHDGSSKDGSVFFIGTYISKQNKSYRAYCLLKKTGEKYLIQQLQFESD